jgi:hypothetical protein
LAKIERKYLAHYIDSAFNAQTPEYVRLGSDLEEYSVELNPDVESKQNILGENSVVVNGYEASSTVEPYYCDSEDKLSIKLMDIAMDRTTSDGCKTTVVEVLLAAPEGDAAPECVWAWKEDCYVVPESIGGDTSGVQVPFTIHRAGNRQKGTFDIATKKFTAN